MYAQLDHTAPSSAVRPTPSRATLQARPLIQRSLIRSWEYNRPIRVTILAIRALVVLWLVVLGVALLSAGSTAGHAWGGAVLAAAVAVAAISTWVFATATKGWPVDNA